MLSLDLVRFSADVAYIVVFAVVAAETSAFLGLLVPGEALIIAAGALAGQGHLRTPILIAAVVIGAVVGDAIGYLLGRRYGFRWADGLARRRSWGQRLRRVRGWMSGPRGGLAVLGGRFIGYVRPLVPFAAGAGGMRYRAFVAYGAPAALVWGSGSVLLGVFFGASGERVIRTFGVGAVAAVTVVLVIVFTVVVIRRRRRAARADLGSTARRVPGSCACHEARGRAPSHLGVRRQLPCRAEARR